jgi:hypothetical protein
MNESVAYERHHDAENVQYIYLDQNVNGNDSHQSDGDLNNENDCETLNNDMPF